MKTIKDSISIQDVLQERDRQDVKWGEQNHYPEQWLVILGEEFGEACNACLNRNLTAIDYLNSNYRKELVQIAAVAIAAIESLDRDQDNPENR